MLDVLDILFGIVMFVDVYVILFFRLLVKRDNELNGGQRETTFGAIFSVPSRQHLSPSGRTALRNFWLALGVMLLCIGYIALTRIGSGVFRWPQA